MTNILYNNKNCPFCARARNALFFAKVDYQLIEVDFNNKPEALLKISPKGTVPVFVSTDGTVIDESIEIVRYCAKQASGDNWLTLTDTEEEAYLNDFQTNFLNPVREHRLNHNDVNSEYIASEYLIRLDNTLKEKSFIAGDKVSMVDIMIAPFISRFLLQNTHEAENYENVARWLEIILRK
jgi:glutathione S-transferase